MGEGSRRLAMLAYLIVSIASMTLLSRTSVRIKSDNRVYQAQAMG